MSHKKYFALVIILMLSLMVGIASAQPPRPTPPPPNFTPLPPTPIQPRPSVTPSPTNLPVEPSPTLRGLGITPTPTKQVTFTPTPDFPITNFMPLNPIYGRRYITRDNILEVGMLARIVPPNYFEGYGLVAVEFSPDGRYIVIGGNEGIVYLYDFIALRRGETEPLFGLSHSFQTLWDVAFHPYLDQLTTCSADGFITTVDFAGNELARIQAPVAATQCNYSPNGDLFGYSGANEVYLYRVDAFGNLTQETDTPFTVPSAHDVIFSPTGTLFFTSGGSGITYYDTAGRNSILEGVIGSNIWSVNPLPNGNVIATGSSGLVALLNSDGMEITQFDGHDNDVIESAYNPDAKLFATGSWDNQLLIWDATGETTAPLTSLNHGEYIVDVAWSRDGALIASVGNNGYLILWGLP